MLSWPINLGQRIQAYAIGKRWSFQQMVWGKQDSYRQWRKLDHFLIAYTKVHSKWIKDLNVTPDTRKYLEENTDSNCLDIGCRIIFLDTSLKIKEIKIKSKLLRLHQNKTFSTVKETIHKTKKVAYWMGEDIFK